ncbi:MAG: hypothetical protein WC663_05205 [Patescibacteria group bacterium]|jgi:hypothetical protein
MKIIVYDQEFRNAEIIKEYFDFKFPGNDIVIAGTKKTLQEAISQSQTPFVVILGENELYRISYAKLYGLIPEGTLVIIYCFKETLSDKDIPSSDPKKPIKFIDRNEAGLDIPIMIQWLKSQGCTI